MDAILTFLSENFWATAMLIAALTAPITAFINEKFSLNGVWKQVVAWVISAALVAGTYFGNLVTFVEPAYVSVPLTGILVGLSANGIYDIPTVRKALSNWFGIFNKKKE